MESGGGGGCGSSEQPEISGIGKSVVGSCGGELECTASVCDGGGGSSASMVDVGNGGSVVSDGCDQLGATGSPGVDPRSGARKVEKLAQHVDAGVAPVASTSFKRSGGTGSSTSSGGGGGGRRAVQKRVVTVPISDIGEGSRARGNGSSVGATGGDAAPPPSDSWTWRKYGQKPIKGSPYPRGYYRCSSSKGCPARKQVERSRADPSMLIVTYASEHNHPWPMPRNSSHHASRQSAAAAQAAGLGGGGGGGPPTQQPVAAAKAIPPPPLASSSSTTDEEDMEVDYENVAVEEEEEVEVKVKERILAELEFTPTTTPTTTTTMQTPTTTPTSNAPATTTSSPTSEETETFSADHSGASDVDSTTLMPPLAPEGGVVVDDDLCSTWFPSVSGIPLCSTADTASTMLPFSYDELLADLGGRSGGGGGYGVDEDEESMFAGLGELPEFSLVFRRGILPEHAADFGR